LVGPCLRDSRRVPLDGKAALFLGVKVASHKVILLDLSQEWLFDNTSLMRVWAARIESTAWRRVHGARNLAADHIRPLVARIRNRNGRDESLRVGMKRRIDQVRR